MQGGPFNDPKRITGGGGYNDESNIAIGKSPEVDVLLFDTYSKDIEEGKDSGWKYDYFRQKEVPDKPMINVEIFGGWTQKFVPPGVYPDEGKQIHIREIEEAKKEAGPFMFIFTPIHGSRGLRSEKRQGLILAEWGLLRYRE